MAEVYVSMRTALLPGGEPVADVLVALYNGSGTKLTTDTTDVDGMAYLGDRAEGEYTVYVTTPAGVTVVGGNRASITVVGAAPQVFDLLAVQDGLPVASDSRLCRCSGYFVDQHGRPRQGVKLLLTEGTLPQLLHYSSTGVSKAVVPYAAQLVADATGWMSVDLIRGATYSASMAGYSNAAWDVVVPDLPASSLPDVLFPVVSGIAYADNGQTLLPTSAPTLSMSVGEEKELSITTQYLSGLLEEGASKVLLTSSDVAVLTITLTSTGVLLQAIAAGTATVGVARSETEETQASAYPYPTPWGNLSVTVT